MAETNYEPWAMPALSSVLDKIRSNPGAWRVRIVHGRPRYHYHNRYIKHVHANVRYKNGVETFRSRHLTDSLLDKPVARAVLDFEHRSAIISVFIPYGRMKRRPEKTSGDSPGNQTGSAPLQAPPDDGYDELPFN